MSNTYTIWEKAKKPNLSDWLKFPKISYRKIETGFEKLYPGYNAVLFSSGRSAINSILKLFKLSRSNLVFCSRWSSHCVLESISYDATPITSLSNINDQPLDAAIIYHQWGYLHENFNLQTNKNLVINDFADSLLIRNPLVLRKNLDFIILSLPKTLGTFTGGIILCKSKDDSISLRNIRESRSKELAHLQSFIKYFSNKDNLPNRYWNSVEPISGRLTWYVRSQIWRFIQDFDKIVNYRLENIEFLSKTLYSYVLKTGIIPSSLPINIKIDSAKENINKKFLIEEKHLNSKLDYLNNNWLKTLLIPTHISIHTLEKIIKNYKSDLHEDLVDISPLKNHIKYKNQND